MLGQRSVDAWALGGETLDSGLWTLGSHSRGKEVSTEFSERICFISSGDIVDFINYAMGSILKQYVSLVYSGDKLN